VARAASDSPTDALGPTAVYVAVDGDGTVIDVWVGPAQNVFADDTTPERVAKIPELNHDDSGSLCRVNRWRPGCLPIPHCRNVSARSRALFNSKETAFA
jgi:hypothetical protein